MDVSTLLLFVPACFALNLAPGPNNLLSVSNATRYGFRLACHAGAGRLVAFAGMIALAATGLAAVLQTSATLFHVIKLVGAAYLFYLAWQLWRTEPSTQQEVTPPVRGVLALMRQEFLVAVGNPKAILIFTAFLPQFIDPARPVAAQFVVLGMLFLVFEAVAIALYAAVGTRLRDWFRAPRSRRIFNRSCAGLLSGAGLGLLLARRA